MKNYHSLDLTNANFQTICEYLENIGKTNPKDTLTNTNLLFKLADHSYKKIRFLAIKNLGKLCNINHLAYFFEKFSIEVESDIKRELVSCIGRLRTEKNIPILLQIIEDNDPKLVAQAIRGLLVHKSNAFIQQKLKELINHPNEMIRTIIYKEFYSVLNNTSKLPHNQTFDFLKNIVIHTDVMNAISLIPDESIHLTFTSPPYYNARDYSIYSSYQEYLSFLDDLFKQVHRITKEGRFLIINTSPIIIPRMSRSHSSKRYGIPFDLHSYLVKENWEFIDDIIWLKPESSVKNRIGGFMQHRKPLAYKPNCITEYLMVYRKKTDKLLDWNIRSYDDNIVKESKVADGYESNNVWKIDPCFDKVHSAVFPAELCKRVIQYYSFKNDLIFDPFAGSGTVGRVAKALDRYFILTEQNLTYFNYMKSKTKSNELFANDFETKFLSLEEFKSQILKK